MASPGSEERARDLARAHLRSAPAGARLADPLPVRDPAGSVESWFVPVVVGDLMVGYVRVGTTAAYSQLGGTPPPVAAWTDPDSVRRVATAAGHAPAAAPYLGYDGVPARIAWVVPVTGGVVYVAGDAVWQ